MISVVDPERLRSRLAAKHSEGGLHGTRAGAGRIRPRRVWPGIRALTGGVLITLAVAGFWWSYTRSTATPSTRYMVAVTEIAPGVVLGSDHVGLQAIDLPSSVATGAFGASRDAEVLGAVAVNVIGVGELITSTDIRPVAVGDGVQSRYELSFEIDLARVLNGQLLAGELVDIVATNGTGATAQTLRIAADAQVLSVAEIGGGGLGLGTVAVTVGVVSTPTVIAIVAANDQGVLTLVRVPRIRERPLTAVPELRPATTPRPPPPIQGQFQ